MVSRSLTEVFVLMRNNAIHSRQIFTEHSNDSERVRLMRSSNHDLEASMETRQDSNAPPPWVDALEEAHYIMTRLKTKLTELQQRHERQIRRPALDDSTEQQHIGRLAAEIGRHFTHAHSHLTAIKAQVRHALDDGTEQQHIGRLAAEIGRHFTHAHSHLTAIKAQVRHALDDSTEQQHIGRLAAEIGRHFTHAHSHLTAIKAQVRHALDDSTEQQHIGRLAAEIGRHFTHAHSHLTAIKAQVRHVLDDSTEQQWRLVAEIGRHFTHAHSHLTAIKAQVRHGNKTEQKLAKNVVLALVTTLQDLSHTFRTAQSHYLRSLTSREERSNAYFDLPNFEELSLDDDTELLPGLTSNQTDLLFSLPSTSGMQKSNYMDDEQTMDDAIQKQYNQKQLLLLQEENTKIVAEREEEVNKIVRSIMDLNEIFKDLGQMVNEQGTVLDRIDYNIEQTQVQVQEGYKQLQKAERYQQKNRKMHCILILAVTLIIMMILLIIVKS